MKPATINQAIDILTDTGDADLTRVRKLLTNLRDQGMLVIHQHGKPFVGIPYAEIPFSVGKHEQAIHKYAADYAIERQTLTASTIQIVTDFNE